jgi:hypothetical protein
MSPRGRALRVSPTRTAPQGRFAWATPVCLGATRCSLAPQATPAARWLASTRRPASSIVGRAVLVATSPTRPLGVLPGGVPSTAVRILSATAMGTLPTAARSTPAAPLPTVALAVERACRGPTKWLPARRGCAPSPAQRASRIVTAIPPTVARSTPAVRSPIAVPVAALAPWPTVRPRVVRGVARWPRAPRASRIVMTIPPTVARPTRVRASRTAGSVGVPAGQGRRASRGSVRFPWR